MDILLLFGFIAILLFILVQAAEYVEDAFVYLARKLKVNEFFVGFGILGIVTSLPEIAIAASSSSDAPELSIGNLLGATLILLTLIIGGSILKYGNLSFRGKFGQYEIILSLLSISLIVGLLLDKTLSVTDGVFLMASYGVYLFYISNKFKNKQHARQAKVFASKVFAKFLKAAFSIIILLVASSLLVDVSVELASLLEVSESLIGLFVVAIGTNIPEITLLLTSPKEEDKVKNLVIGNFIGSASANVGIAGFLAIMSSGFTFTNFLAIIPVCVLLSFVLVLFMWFSWTGKEITKKEATLLILLYFVFLITELIILVGKFHD